MSAYYKNSLIIGISFLMLAVGYPFLISQPSTLMVLGGIVLAFFHATFIFRTYINKQ